MSGTNKKNLNLRLQKPIVLVGMMGAGKTSLGQVLAQVLGFSFFDSDSLIEQEAGMPVSSVFEVFGEEKFRESEARILRELFSKGPCVIATGGGAVMNEETLALFKAQAVMVWLDVEEAVLWARLQGSKTRPLLKVDNPRQRVLDLLAARRPFYNQAHVHLALGNETPAQCLDKLIKSLSEALNNGSF